MYPVHYFKSVSSTNLNARELAENCAINGTAVIAENQTSGRGRLGKSWHSKAGKGLYCSIIVRPDLQVHDYPKITLATGLAVSVTLDRLSAKSSHLKWPNDIYFSGKKCGGILTESSGFSGGRDSWYAVIGIGINVNNTKEDFPVDLRKDVTSLLLETGQRFEITDLFEKLREDVLSTLDLFCQKGFAPILSEWKKKDYLLGKKMQCVAQNRTIVEGVALGPDDEGQLHVRDIDGHVHSVLSGDVRLAL